jgi:hypothetical protein
VVAYTQRYDRTLDKTTCGGIIEEVDGASTPSTATTTYVVEVEGTMANLTLNENEEIEISFIETDGTVKVIYDCANNRIIVESDIPDDVGRHGTIYHSTLTSSNDGKK